MSFFPQPANTSRSLVDLMIYNNSVTGNWFGMLLTIMIFVIMFISLKGYSTEKAFASASLTTTIATILLSVMGVVSASLVSIYGIMTLASLFFLRD